MNILRFPTRNFDDVLTRAHDAADAVVQEVVAHYGDPSAWVELQRNIVVASGAKEALPILAEVVRAEGLAQTLAEGLTLACIRRAGLPRGML